MQIPIRTRFAPSPTGYLHVGGLRTALYAYLFARKHEGTFILRIEDTDQARTVEGAMESLMKSLKFFDLNWDEGPYIQSQRTDLYRNAAETLLKSGHAYRCFCTSERLDAMRLAQQQQKVAPKYDRTCLNLSSEQIEAKLAAGEPFVLRQLIPNEEITFKDMVRGDVTFHGKDVDDQVLLKSDGFPTYHLANVVDDHDMRISHVIRGEEWLPSTPKHIWLYQAFGWTPPEFAHLPLLLNADKSKLSKRQGDVAAEDYIQKGYLKEALLNFIAFLGWNPGTEEELFTLPELVQRFSFDRVQKAGAVFSLEKLDWLNGLYLRKKTSQELAVLLMPYLEKTDWFARTQTSENDLLKYIHCAQTRMETLEKAPQHLKPFLLSELNYDLAMFNSEKMKVDRATALMAIENSIPALETLEENPDEESIKAALMKVIESMGVKNGQVLWPLRVALTAEEFSPGVFELIQVMGREMALKRLKSAQTALAR